MNRVKSVNRVFLATVLMSIVGAYINSWVLEYTNNYFFILLISQIMLVLPSLVYLSMNRLSVTKAIRFHKIRPSNVILIILFSYLITPLMNFINAISMIYVQNDTTTFMNGIIEGNGLWLSIFIVAFVPCVLEETVYRGVFYNEYSKINPLKGILLSGFLFGIIHGNLNQFSYAFAMGIVFALLIEATNSILATMIVHFFINGTSIILWMIIPKLFQFLEKVYGSEYFNAKELMETATTGVMESLDLSYVFVTYGLQAIIGTILAFIVYRAIAKNSGRWEYVKGIFNRRSYVERPVDVAGDGFYNEDRHEAKPRLLTIGLVIGIAISVVSMILNEII